MKKRIKDIAEIQVGLYAKSSPGANAVYLQVSSFDSDRRLSENLKPTVIIEGKKCHSLLREGDLLFVAKGSYNFCTIYHAGEYPAVASTSFLVLRIKFLELVLPEYVCWYINLHSTLKLLATDAAKGTAIPSISKADLEELELPIPSLECQERILKISQLQAREACILKQLQVKRQQVLEYKLKSIIANEHQDYTRRHQ